MQFCVKRSFLCSLDPVFCVNGIGVNENKPFFGACS